LLLLIRIEKQLRINIKKVPAGLAGIFFGFPELRCYFIPALSVEPGTFKEGLKSLAVNRFMIK